MKIETLTPQIAAMYLGQKCTCKWIESGDSADFKISTLTLNDLSYSLVVVTPHLLRLESLTEAEARELYEITKGHPFDREDSGEDALEYLKEYYITFYGFDSLIGQPHAWLHLLSKGFDIFGLIDAGLAKEITN